MVKLFGYSAFNCDITYIFLLQLPGYQTQIYWKLNILDFIKLMRPSVLSKSLTQQSGGYLRIQNLDVSIICVLNTDVSLVQKYKFNSTDNQQRVATTTNQKYDPAPA